MENVYYIIRWIGETRGVNKGTVVGPSFSKYRKRFNSISEVLEDEWVKDNEGVDMMLFAIDEDDDSIIAIDSLERTLKNGEMRPPKRVRAITSTLIADCGNIFTDFFMASLDESLLTAEPSKDAFLTDLKGYGGIVNKAFEIDVLVYDIERWSNGRVNCLCCNIRKPVFVGDIMDRAMRRGETNLIGYGIPTHPASVGSIIDLDRAIMPIYGRTIYNIGVKSGVAAKTIDEARRLSKLPSKIIGSDDIYLGNESIIEIHEYNGLHFVTDSYPLVDATNQHMVDTLTITDVTDFKISEDSEPVDYVEAVDFAINNPTGDLYISEDGERWATIPAHILLDWYMMNELMLRWVAVHEGSKFKLGEKISFTSNERLALPGKLFTNLGIDAKGFKHFVGLTIVGDDSGVVETVYSEDE